MGILNSLAEKVLKEYGITEDDIKKVKNLLDHVKVIKNDDSLTIEIDLKKINVKISK